MGETTVGIGGSVGFRVKALIGVLGAVEAESFIALFWQLKRFQERTV